MMPADVVTQHTPVPGEPSPYGLVILGFQRRAARVTSTSLPLDPSSDNPQQVPLGCFDTNNNQLGPDDWVLGFTRIYAYEPDAGADGGPVTNANPIVASIDVAGSPLAVTPVPTATQTYTTPTFTTPHCAGSCPHVAIGPVVPIESWETTQQIDMNNNPEHEEIFADFYSTIGQFSSDATLLYDATSWIHRDRPASPTFRSHTPTLIRELAPSDCRPRQPRRRELGDHSGGGAVARGNVVRAWGGELTEQPLAARPRHRPPPGPWRARLSSPGRPSR